MNSWQIAILIVYSVVILVSLLRHFVCTYEMRQATFLTPESPQRTDSDAPFVSIMVPAKDEEDGIGNCLRSLLAQDYPNFEIIVIDDRSEDETAAIVLQFVEEHHSVRLVQIDTLPEGWTGKTHALQIGQQHAFGEWLLFVDADTQHHPVCLSVVMQDCLESGADMESLLPALEANSFWEAVVQPFVATYLMVLFPLSRANNPLHQQSGYANGQFILVRRDAYDKIGKHESVRDKFVEDIHLGRRARQLGLHLRMVVGTSLSRVRMYSSLTEIIRGWSRIFYAAVDFRAAKLLPIFALVIALNLLPYLVMAIAGGALLTGMAIPFVIWSLALGITQEIVQWSVFARTYRASGCQRRYLAFRFLAICSMLVILARTVRLCQTHRVIWRGTTYHDLLRTQALPENPVPEIEMVES